ncbi:MAG: hypothetical protein DRG11_05495 [Epsilonproteobacteria bacterium]|nr:MAG: hypothetical protein DRG11_05495 [Campylobacterota bacterium]
MRDIVLSLVFAAPLLIIMVYPAMKIADLISKKFHINQQLDDKLTIILTIVLSLIGGIVLSYY